MSRLDNRLDGLNYDIVARENPCSLWKDILPSPVRHLTVEEYEAKKIKENYLLENKE